MHTNTRIDMYRCIIERNVRNPEGPRALAQAKSKGSQRLSASVINYDLWRPRRDSNLQPLGPKPIVTRPTRSRASFPYPCSKNGEEFLATVLPLYAW